MSSSVSQTGLTEARRNVIIKMLAHGQSKRAIGIVVGVHERTIGRWLKRHPSLKEAAAEQQAVNYHRAIERLDEIAFDTKVKPTAETQFKALVRIADKFEAEARRKDGELSTDRAEEMVRHVASVLLEFPEAREKVLEAFPDAPDEIALGDTYGVQQH